MSQRSPGRIRLTLALPRLERERRLEGVRFAVALAVLATILAAPAKALTVLDTFPGTTLSSNWTPLSGTWGVSGGTLNQTASSLSDFAIHVLEWNAAPAGANFSFQVDATIPAGTPAGYDAVGIVFRFQDASNYYRMLFFPGYGGGAFRFDRVAAGVLTEFTGNQDMGFTPAQGSFYTIRVVGTGSSYTAYVKNGVAGTEPPWDYIFTRSDATFSGGYVGLIDGGGPGMFQRFASGDPVVPEPTSLALLALSIPLLLRRRRRSII